MGCAESAWATLLGCRTHSSLQRPPRPSWSPSAAAAASSIAAIAGPIEHWILRVSWRRGRAVWPLSDGPRGFQVLDHLVVVCTGSSALARTREAAQRH
jgi:hypothetical protein